MNKKIPSKYKAQLYGGDVYQNYQTQRREIIDKIKKRDAEKRINQIITEQVIMALDQGSQDVADRAV